MVIAGPAPCPTALAGLAPDAVAATAVAFIVLSHRLARSTLASLAGNTLAAGVLGVVMVLATIALVFSDAGPLHDVGGLVQRLTPPSSSPAGCCCRPGCSGLRVGSRPVRSARASPCVARLVAVPRR